MIPGRVLEPAIRAASPARAAAEPALAGPVLAVPVLAVPAMVFTGIALVLLSLTLSSLDRPPTAVVWGAAAMTAYCAGLLCLAGTLHGDLGLSRWKAGPWFLLWCGAAFGIATVTWSQPQSGTPAQISVDSVLRALWLVAAGIGAWAAGYIAGPGASARRLCARATGRVRMRRTAAVRSPAAPWILYSIGIAARLASTAVTGRFGYAGDAASAVSTATGYGQILSALGLCAPLAVAAASLQVYWEHRPGAKVTLAVLFLAEISLAAASGFKQNVVVTVLAWVIPYSAARRRMPKAILAGSAAAFLLVVIPFNHAYRESIRSGPVTLTPAQAVSEAPGILRQSLVGGHALTTLSGSAAYLLQRIRQIDSAAIIMQRTPGQIKFLSPLHLAEDPVAGMVPRAIWPGKPISATGYQFGQEYFGLSSSEYTSTAETTPGGLYRYGGWVPVLAGMFLLGCGIRLLDDTLDVRSNPHAIFLLLLLFPYLVQGQEDWTSILATIPATVTVWLVAVFLTFAKPGRLRAGKMPGAT